MGWRWDEDGTLRTEKLEETSSTGAVWTVVSGFHRVCWYVFIWHSCLNVSLEMEDQAQIVLDDQLHRRSRYCSCCEPDFICLMPLTKRFGASKVGLKGYHLSTCMRKNTPFHRKKALVFSSQKDPITLPRKFVSSRLWYWCCFSCVERGRNRSSIAFCCAAVPSLCHAASWAWTSSPEGRARLILGTHEEALRGGFKQKIWSLM